MQGTVAKVEVDEILIREASFDGQSFEVCDRSSQRSHSVLSQFSTGSGEPCHKIYLYRKSCEDGLQTGLGSREPVLQGLTRRQ